MKYFTRSQLDILEEIFKQCAKNDCLMNQVHAIFKNHLARFHYDKLNFVNDCMVAVYDVENVSVSHVVLDQLFNDVEALQPSPFSYTQKRYLEETIKPLKDKKIASHIRSIRYSHPENKDLLYLYCSKKCLKKIIEQLEKMYPNKPSPSPSPNKASSSSRSGSSSSNSNNSSSSSKNSSIVVKRNSSSPKRPKRSRSLSRSPATTKSVNQKREDDLDLFSDDVTDEVRENKKKQLKLRYRKLQSYRKKLKKDKMKVNKAGTWQYYEQRPTIDKWFNYIQFTEQDGKFQNISYNTYKEIFKSYEQGMPELKISNIRDQLAELKNNCLNYAEDLDGLYTNSTNSMDCEEEQMNQDQRTVKKWKDAFSNALSKLQQYHHVILSEFEDPEQDKVENLDKWKSLINQNNDKCLYFERAVYDTGNWLCKKLDGKENCFRLQRGDASSALKAMCYLIIDSIIIASLQQAIVASNFEISHAISSFVEPILSASGKKAATLFSTYKQENPNKTQISLEFLTQRIVAYYQILITSPKYLDNMFTQNQAYQSLFGSSVFNFIIKGSTLVQFKSKVIAQDFCQLKKYFLDNQDKFKAIQNQRHSIFQVKNKNINMNWTQQAIVAFSDIIKKGKTEEDHRLPGLFSGIRTTLKRNVCNKICNDIFVKNLQSKIDFFLIHFISLWLPKAKFFTSKCNAPVITPDDVYENSLLILKEFGLIGIRLRI